MQRPAYSRCSFRRLARPSFSSVRRRTRPRRLIAAKATTGAPCFGVVARVPAGITHTMVTDRTRTAGRVFQSSRWKRGYRSPFLPLSPCWRPRAFHSRSAPMRYSRVQRSELTKVERGGTCAALGDLRGSSVSWAKRAHSFSSSVHGHPEPRPKVRAFCQGLRVVMLAIALFSVVNPRRMNDKKQNGQSNEAVCEILSFCPPFFSIVPLSWVYHECLPTHLALFFLPLMLFFHLCRRHAQHCWENSRR